LLKISKGIASCTCSSVTMFGYSVATGNIVKNVTCGKKKIEKVSIVHRMFTNQTTQRSAVIHVD